MTFWIDAQLDPDLAAWLGSRFGVIAKHLIELALARAKDEELYEAARRFGQIVIMSKDSDFAELSRRLGAPSQIVHLRCGNLSTIELQVLLARAFPDALDRLKHGDPLVEIHGP